MLKDWAYSLFMLAVYIGLFNIWLHLPELAQTAVTISGAAAALALAVGMWLYRSSFVNRTDMLCHAFVILDILLETVVDLEYHQHNGFYVCALALALVVGGHRWWCLRRARATAESQQAP